MNITSDPQCNNINEMQIQPKKSNQHKNMSIELQHTIKTDDRIGNFTRSTINRSQLGAD